MKLSHPAPDGKDHAPAAAVPHAPPSGNPVPKAGGLTRVSRPKTPKAPAPDADKPTPAHKA